METKEISLCHQYIEPDQPAHQCSLTKPCIVLLAVQIKSFHRDKWTVPEWKIPGGLFHLRNSAG